MVYAILAIVALVLGYLLYSKIRKALFVAKDISMVKEDQALMVKETELKKEIANIKAEIKPSADLTPAEVEDYWSKK